LKAGLHGRVWQVESEPENLPSEATCFFDQGQIKCVSDTKPTSEAVALDPTLADVFFQYHRGRKQASFRSMIRGVCHNNAKGEKYSNQKGFRASTKYEIRKMLQYALIFCVL
jgi:hypothetical protein